MCDIFSEEDLNWCKDNLINYWALKEADNIRQNLASIMMARFKLNLFSSDINNSINIRKSILAGYFIHVAHLDSTGNYITLESNKVCKDIIFSLYHLSPFTFYILKYSICRW